MAMTNGMNYNTPGFNPYTQNFYPTYPQIHPIRRILEWVIRPTHILG